MPNHFIPGRWKANNVSEIEEINSICIIICPIWHIFVRFFRFTNKYFHCALFCRLAGDAEDNGVRGVQLAGHDVFVGAQGAGHRARHQPDALLDTAVSTALTTDH